MKTTTTKPILYFDLILMSTLAWITEKELERKVENEETNFVVRKTTILYIAAVRKRGNVSGHQSENERQRKQK